MRSNRNKIILSTISVFVIFAIIGVTYAYVSKTLAGTKKVILTAGTLSLVLAEENEITLSDALPMYDAVGMIQEKVFNFSLNNNTSNLTEYTIKLQKVSTSNELSTSDVKYYLTKDGVGTPALLSSLNDGVVDTGTIAGNQTIEYTLRLWIRDGVTENTAISGKSLSYKLVVEASMSEDVAIATDTVSTKLFASENLGENCKTYDDGTDTFLVKQCSQNYVWYSGKLWRVVLKNNETGTVKMVTDNEVTVIRYSESGNTVFDGSEVDQWLTQEFLPTLHDYEDYLVVNSIWDATTDANDVPLKPTFNTSVTRTVGLLNAYEYYITGAGAYGFALNTDGYLNNETEWWLMTPVNNNNVAYVNDYGNLGDNGSILGTGIRPSINLQSTVKIKSGTGIKSDPYILEGDLQEPVNGATLLNTRYSGEYVTFNNELYRIVDTENGLAKITAVDKPSIFSDNVFDSNNSVNFANSSIRTDLENYYQSLKTSNVLAYNMIEPNTTWYLGDANYSYKATICATVNDDISARTCTRTTTTAISSIGLPRVGEMFTGQIARGTKNSFWTLSPYISSSSSTTPTMTFISNDGSSFFYIPSRDYGARPSMYLKSNVVISSNNTGNGTYDHPYSLSIN